MKDDMKWIVKDHSKSLFECETCGQKTLSFKDFAPPRFIMQIYQIWDQLDINDTGALMGSDEIYDALLKPKKFLGQGEVDGMDSVLKKEQIEQFAKCLHLMITHNVATSKDKKCYKCLIDMGRDKLHLTQDEKFTNFVFFMLLDLEMVKLHQSDGLSTGHKIWKNNIDKFRTLDWKEQLDIIHGMREFYSETNSSWFREAGRDERMVSILPSLLTIIDYISDDIEFNVTDMKKEWGTV